MKNLAGNKEANYDILEELAIADIKAVKVNPSQGEVPYSFVGSIGNWTLKRAWYYWIAAVEDPKDGLILENAIELYNKVTPNGGSFGDVIRCAGHGGGISPEEYGSQPIYDEAFTEQCKAKGYATSFLGGKEYPDLDYGEIAELCKAGKLVAQRYVSVYHIDTQLGLCEFSKFIKQLTN